MRILSLFLSIMTLSTFVSANICDSNWLEGADGSDVQAFIEAGADVNQICNSLTRNRPLHHALLAEGIHPDIIEVFIDADANVYAENSDERTPMDFAETRFSRATARYSRGSDDYEREEAIFESIRDIKRYINH